MTQKWKLRPLAPLNAQFYDSKCKISVLKFSIFSISPLWVTVLWCRNPHMVVFWCHIYLEPFGVVFEYYGMFLCILNHLCICFAVYSHEKCPCKICFVLLVNNRPSAFGLLVWTAMPLRKSFETVSDPTWAFLTAFSHCSRVLLLSRKMYWITFVSLSCPMSNQSNYYRYWLTEAWSLCIKISASCFAFLLHRFCLQAFWV